VLLDVRVCAELLVDRHGAVALPALFVELRDLLAAELVIVVTGLLLELLAARFVLLRSFGVAVRSGEERAPKRVTAVAGLLVEPPAVGRIGALSVGVHLTERGAARHDPCVARRLKESQEHAFLLLVVVLRVVIAEIEAAERVTTVAGLLVERDDALP